MSQNQSKKALRKKQRERQKWIPALVVLGGLLLVVIGFLALREKPTPGASIEVTGAPSLKVDKEQVDLGDMKFNSLANVSFTLTNVGDQTLMFSEAPYIEVVEGC